MRKILSIIITFLNEKEEVVNTLNSLFSTVEHDINIIVIDDASNDGYDYESKLSIFQNIRYVKNEYRLGVAGSRNKGVKLCTTPYFIFLDAHMRFYNKGWYQSMVDELEKDDKNIICSQTKFLKQINGKVEEDLTEKISYGAYINLHETFHYFELWWLIQQEKNSKNQSVINVPSIIGGAYACSKRNWNYLKGLEGLKTYGLDEAYLSIKTWLTGGRCKLLKKVPIGHNYRINAPYNIDDISQIYNKIFLLCLFNTFDLKKKYFSLMRFFYPQLFISALKEVCRQRRSIYNLKLYYSKIFEKDFSYFIQKNYSISHIKINCDKEINIIANYVIENIYSINDKTVKNGEAGILIFLFHYARFSKNDPLDKFCKLRLTNLVNDSNTTDIEIGWLNEYLYQHNFISEKIYGKLNVIHYALELINEYEEIKENKKILWCIRYALARIYSSKKNQSILNENFN